MTADLTPEAALARAATDYTIDEIEWLAGKLLVVSAKLRKDRMGPGDVHEMRHLLRAVESGNSDECGPLGESCVLDQPIHSVTAEAADREAATPDGAGGSAPSAAAEPEALALLRALVDGREAVLNLVDGRPDMSILWDKARAYLTRHDGGGE